MGWLAERLYLATAGRDRGGRGTGRSTRHAMDGASNDGGGASMFMTLRKAPKTRGSWWDMRWTRPMYQLIRDSDGHETDRRHGL